MENKKLPLTIGIVTFIMCFVFVTIIVVMIDLQQHTIINQTQKIDESQKIIEEQTQNLNEFESGEKFSKLNQELLSLQLQLDENNEKMQENQSKIEQKNIELDDLSSRLNIAQAKLTEQEQKLAEQTSLINEQKARLDVLSQNLDYEEQLKLLEEQKLQIDSFQNEINQLKADLNEKNTSINSLNDQIKSLNNTISAQQAKLDEQAIIIETGGVSLDVDILKVLQEKQNLITEQQSIIDEQTNALNAQTELTSQLQQKLEENALLISEKDNQILHLFTEVKSLNEKIANMERIIEEQNALLDANTTHFVVTYVAGGTLIDKIVVEKGENVTTIPQIPQKQGYLADWSENGESINENKLIYAIYTPINYEINYDFTIHQEIPFRFATFNLNDTQHTIDFLKKSVTFTNECEIVDEKFTIKDVTYTLDTENMCVRAGKKSYPIDNNSFIIDRIYKIANNKITWESNVSFDKNSFTINDKTYSLVENKIISDDYLTDIISFSQPELNFTYYLSNNTLTYIQNNKQTNIKVNNQFVINNKTYQIDLINHSFNLILGKSTFKTMPALVNSFTIEDKYFVLPKVTDVINSTKIDDKTYSPVSWHISGIDYLINEDDNYIYIFPLNSANLSISINWE